MSERLDSIIVRLGGEIWIKKSWTKRWYLRRLVRNIKTTLNHYNVTYSDVFRKNGRIFLRTGKALEAAERLSRVFGISSVSPAVETGIRLEAIIDGCLFLAEELVKEGDSFAVRCRHVGKHLYTRQEICVVVGRRVLEKFTGRGVRVALDNPDVILGIEIRHDMGFVFSNVIRGVGGFPLGVQGRLVGLLSGGLDSAVACWLVMKRGCPVVPLYFDCTRADESAKERAIEVAEALSEWAIGFPRRLYIVDYQRSLKEIVEEAPRRLTCLLCKRLMYRVAERIADEVGAEGLVTGEAIGEQASQTLRNLSVLDNAAARHPVHRPLLGFDKAETEALARKIGTYDVSARSVKGCEAAPHKPTTKARLDEVEKAESRLDVEKMVGQCLRELTVMDL